MCIRDSHTGVEVSGREIRDFLASNGHRRTLPTFYRKMGQLEHRGLVKTSYEQEVVKGYTVKRAIYVITGEGQKLFGEYSAWYQHWLSQLSNKNKGGLPPLTAPN